MDHTAVRDYKIRKEQGQKIRKIDNTSKEQMRIIDEAIIDFRNGRLSVKEFLYLIAGRYEPWGMEQSDEMSEVTSIWKMKKKKL